MAERTRLIFRADGNPRIGLGHVMRLLALAEILREQFACVFAIQEPSPEVLAQLRAVCEEVVEMAPQPAAGEPAWLRQHVLRPTDVLVLDGYGFELNYQEAVRPAVARLVCLDDLHAFPFVADLVLNPAGGVTQERYDLRTPGARLLAGPAYAPLRTAFREVVHPVPSSALATTILVCLGGADPTHQTQQVTAALLQLPATEHVHAVVGSAYAGWEGLQTWAQDQARLTLHRNLPAAELCQLMQTCGAAVCSPSTISYEYCAAGGGLLFLLPTAANQHDLDLFLRLAGLALPYASASNVLTSPEADRISLQLRQAQQHYFDGQAPQRLRQEFAALVLPSFSLQLRPVAPADSEQLFEWANEPAVRQHSFNPNPISLAEHEQWFQNRLNDPNSILLIAEDSTTRQAAGLIRFSVENTEATLSYLLGANYRGKGLAAGLLAAGTWQLLQQFPAVRQVVGHVQATNLASIRAFERAGFQELSFSETANANSRTFYWLSSGIYPIFRALFYTT
ncbi:UDP-2,4-diacetamido-2,4,6-trideoxy-beta-L-altropyranose hydrolase [Hymenobacter sp. GOD-10R]|uniref:UDP-2,4-diacetamido-2,4, 6-trideoxy-beta-L-altropyranose hydrolase n=1 Tax=Hymenobacter sp. GOD-10R TaxID=3093922 RepID=UPI002D78C2CD|nr:UDP-2,4-diacetamido-2,4,6-trideoxy-beta-L-altropyranose hydrolase [Hymenobacter sp. GOD-10R]WRQ26639.1 UDP-2,4-diacetamido-2,4,6-trideoxy-beta-L-altropyranose hydrolase [Hymenobacter sp. GOD-10R]